jgi:hypothetical protein
MQLRTVTQDAFFSAPPHDIFETYVDEAREAGFSGGPAQFERKAGGKFALCGGTPTGTRARCRVARSGSNTEFFFELRGEKGNTVLRASARRRWLEECDFLRFGSQRPTCPASSKALRRVEAIPVLAISRHSGRASTGAIHANLNGRSR